MSAVLKLRVRNFAGIKRADLDIVGPVLIAGTNGAGKSSLLQSVACAVVQSPLAREMATKKGAGALLHEGADAGSISLDYGSGSVRVLYPDATVETSGKPATLGSPLGIGSARFTALTPADKAKQVSERFKTDPGLEDLRAWFEERPEAGVRVIKLADGTERDLLAALWERIELSGWDAVATDLKDHLSRRKGAWEGVTGQRWGAKVAKGWTPPGLLPGEDMDVDAAKLDEAHAQQRLEGLIAQAAVSGAHREAVSALAAKVEALAADVERIVGEGDAIADQLTAARAKLDAAPVPIDTDNMQACPHCGKKIAFGRAGDKRQYTILEKPPEQISKAARDEQIKKHDELNSQVNALLRTVEANTRDVAAARSAHAAAVNARAEVARLEGLDEVGQPEVDAARERYLELQRRRASIEAWHKATAIYREFVQNEFLFDALVPGGVRKAVLSRRLGVINMNLSKLCAIAKFEDVQLTEDLGVTFRGRPYVLLSESERWRCDLIVAALMGREEGARILLIDRLDVLDPNSRGGVVALAKQLGIPVLIAMTAKDISVVPDLSKAKLGITRWLSRGILEG
jgi:outer membrane murein-binding lipoprotein Lpp